MEQGMFDVLPISGVYLSIVMMLLVFFEAGYQIGRRIKIGSERAVSNNLAPMVGGLLAMLAFVLAFTFSLAATQNNLRKQYVIDEANVLGTAYLRADLLEEQYKTEMKHLLKEYVDVRLEAVVGGKTGMKKAVARSEELHTLLWVQASTAALATPGGNSSLVVRSINEVIDLHTKRIAAGFSDRIPSAIWLALFAISGLTMITMGVQAGFFRLRTLVAVIPLILAFSALGTV
ncbi:MAG: hypothetical protein MUP09_10715, partial [Thiovulaceae bacterium]|nr:hypothetical protein [Sulfurimonadaceae bacterium]